MSDRDNGGPAFPVEIRNGGITPVSGFYGDSVDPGKATTYGGMSLRDYFAAKAMSGMVANIVRGHVSYGNTRDMAARCYEIADEMLAERAK